MPFQKGQLKHPDSGMRPGQKSLKVMAWERLGEYIINEGAERYLEYLRKLPDNEFSIEFRAILEFFKPRKKRAEVIRENPFKCGPIKIGFLDE